MDNYVVSTTEDKKNSNEWTIEELYKSPVTIDSLIDTLQIIDILKKKYPNDDTIKNFEEIVRFEICHMFGGIIADN